MLFLFQHSCCSILLYFWNFEYHVRMLENLLKLLILIIQLTAFTAFETCRNRNSVCYNSVHFFLQSLVISFYKYSLVYWAVLVTRSMKINFLVMKLITKMLHEKPVEVKWRINGRLSYLQGIFCNLISKGSVGIFLYSLFLTFNDIIIDCSPHLANKPI